jgi:hypothetical protein
MLEILSALSVNMRGSMAEMSSRILDAAVLAKLTESRGMSLVLGDLSFRVLLVQVVTWQFVFHNSCRERAYNNRQTPSTTGVKTPTTGVKRQVLIGFSNTTCANASN